MSREYAIVIEPLSAEDGGGYLATVPELPGCMSDGATEAEARDNVRDAIAAWLAEMERRQQQLRAGLALATEVGARRGWKLDPRIAAALAALGLCGCVSLPKLHLPASAAPGAAVAPAKPVCPGNLLADIPPEPQLPPTAGFPAPQTEAESAAVTAYGQWLHSFAVWGRDGWARAGDARDYCETAR